MKGNLFLIDTSAWIFALRKNPNEFIKNRIDALLQADLVATTPIVKLELLGGTRTSREFERLKNRLDSLYQLSITEHLWYEAARLAFSLRRKGLTVPYTDILIAAIAMANDTTIFHADEHFDHIAQKSDLKVKSCVYLIQDKK